jgi:hypothetical protein
MEERIKYSLFRSIPRRTPLKETPKKTTVTKAPAKTAVVKAAPVAVKKAAPVAAKKPAAKKAVATPIALVAAAPAHDQISRRAYEIWARRGFTHGAHDQDWAEAERELKRA